MIAASAAVRSVIAWQHSIPGLFPDEYIYAALGRSIGHGHLEIRGETSFFPAILEPVLAAPIWRLFPTETAYHLVQVENAVAASLVVVPVFIVARWLGLGSVFAYVCALYALLVPSLVLVAYTVSDLVAYPLALAAVAAGVRAIDRPTPRAQIVFLAFASLATLARVQYFVLVPAYLVGAAVVDRRGALRRHRVALIALAPAIVIALVAGSGYYAGAIRDTRVNRAFVEWFFLQPYLLALIAGVVIVPGAVAALVRPRGRRETAFAVLVGTFTVLLLAEAAAHSADSSQFKERYLFALLPLIPIAFGLYLKHHRPLRPLVIALAVIIAVAVSRLPMSAYVASAFKTDSQFLFAVSYLEDRFGLDSASLLVAVLATIGSAAAVAVAFRGLGRSALAATIAVAVAATVGAVIQDLRGTRDARALLPRDLLWVDHASRGMVTAVATPLSPQKHLLDPLYWNVSIQREVVLGNGQASDAFAAPKLELAADGTLVNARGEILFDDSGSTGIFADAERVARTTDLSLWRPRGQPRFRLLIEARYADSWLAPAGRIRAWPLERTGTGTTVSFTLSLPRRWTRVVRMKLGPTVFTIRPGSRAEIVCRNASGPLDLRFSSDDIVAMRTFRLVAARLSDLGVADVPGGVASSNGPPCAVVG